MFLPYQDSPNSKSIPYVTLSLMALLVGVFVFVGLPLTKETISAADPVFQHYLRVTPPELIPNNLLTGYDLFVFQYGFRPAEPAWWSWFTSGFLHLGWRHLLGNLLGLWLFGDNVEKRLGWWKFILTYFGLLLVSTQIYSVFTHQPNSPMIGASGAVYGILGLYFLWFPKNQIKTLILVLPVIVQNIQIPARYVLAFFLIVDNLLPFVAGGRPGPPVAYSGHLGGFLAGTMLAILLGRSKGNKRSSWREGGVVRAEEVGRFLRLGFPRRAAASFLALPAQARDDLSIPSLLDLGDRLCQAGGYEAAVQVYKYILTVEQNPVLVARARAGAALIQDRVRHLRTLREQP